MIAVLTGDIVNSTKMSSDMYSSVINELQTVITHAEQHFQAQGEIYRGDEFQLQYLNPVDALKSTLLIKLALHLSKCSAKPIQCTLSLAYGESRIIADKPNTSSGTVFIASGRGLEKTPRGELSLNITDSTHYSDTLLLTQFLNHLLNRLTKTQAELLYQYVINDFAEHKKIAEITGTTRQNISNRLSNIGAFLVRDYLNTINERLGFIGSEH